MKTRKLLTLAGALLLALTGCKTSVNSVENAQKTGQRQMISDQRVITDRSLSSKVSLVGVNTAMTAGGFLKVQIELLNTTHSAQRFSYRFEWFDVNGMQVTSLGTATIPDQIEGGEDKFIAGLAPSPAIRDFRVKFLAN